MAPCWWMGPRPGSDPTGRHTPDPKGSYHDQVEAEIAAIEARDPNRKKSPAKT